MGEKQEKVLKFLYPLLKNLPNRDILFGYIIFPEEEG